MTKIEAEIIAHIQTIFEILRDNGLTDIDDYTCRFSHVNITTSDDDKEKDLHTAD